MGFIRGIIPPHSGPPYQYQDRVVQERSPIPGRVDEADPFELEQVQVVLMAAVQLPA